MVSAKEQMQFQKYMSNTAHVREVRDLQAAGLNPVLSAGGSGASTPTGAMDYSGGGGGYSSSATTAKSIKEGVQAGVKAAKEAFNSAEKMAKSLTKTVAEESQDTFKDLDKTINSGSSLFPILGKAVRAGSNADKAMNGEYEGWADYLARKAAVLLAPASGWSAKRALNSEWVKKHISFNPHPYR